MGRIFVRFLSALVIGAGAGLVTYLAVFELSALETVASLALLLALVGSRLARL